MAPQALEGITVLDLSDRIAGAYCTKLLADCGARVIKVEPPSGDPLRRLGPFPGDAPHPEKGGAFLFLNTNKEGVTLNLGSPTASDLLRRLLSQCQVLVETFPPGYLGSLGLSYAQLQSLHPGLVLTSITSFGQDGPYRDYKAYDLTLQALSGILYVNGEPHLDPVRLPGAQAEFLGGGHAAVATTAAILATEATGMGQNLDCSIMEAAGSILASRYGAFFYKGDVSLRRGNGRGNWAIYPCADGYISLNVYFHGEEWERFKAWVQIPELDDDKFSTAAGRRINVDELETLLLSWFMERDKEELYHDGQRHRVAVGLGSTMEDLQHSRQLAARDYFRTVDHPAAGPLVYPGPPFKLGATPHRTGRAPLLGEHNETVYLRELGLAPQELVRLREAGIV
ncbi:MAG: CoA transferase [Chloroflexi bacterium]|nr:CoA transferase [Chloroflexota bacterium]